MELRTAVEDLAKRWERVSRNHELEAEVFRRGDKQAWAAQEQTKALRFAAHASELRQLLEDTK